MKPNRKSHLFAFGFSNISHTDILSNVTIAYYIPLQKLSIFKDCVVLKKPPLRAPMKSEILFQPQIIKKTMYFEEIKYHIKYLIMYLLYFNYKLTNNFPQIN